jgi:hypothetical protein
MKLITSSDEIDTSPVLDIVDYHLVWFGTPIDHNILCIASLFATQANPRVTLWTSDSYVIGLRERLCPIFQGKNFAVKVFKSEIEGTLYPKETEDKFWTCDDWRLDILYTYGGIYVDMDTLALKDISWVSRYRAMSRWGLERRCNSSIASFPKGDSELLKLIHIMGTMGNRKGWHRPVPNFEWDLLEIDMHCFNVTFFDCGWSGGGVGFDDFFTMPLFHEKTRDGSILGECKTLYFTEPPNAEDPFVGSYMYHWHNRWNVSVRNPHALVGQYWKTFVLDRFHGIDKE